MILIGRYLSPFTRRVAVILHRLDLPFEHRPLSVVDDVPAIQAINPLGRVPALILADGEVLIESSAILDHLDELAGPDRALVPAGGAARRAVLKTDAIVHGALEKAVLGFYETGRRPAEKSWPEMVSRCIAQTQGGLAVLEAQLTGDWLVGDQISRADITLAVAIPFIRTQLPAALAPGYPRLEALAERLGASAPFQATRFN